MKQLWSWIDWPTAGNAAIGGVITLVGSALFAKGVARWRRFRFTADEVWLLTTARRHGNGQIYLQSQRTKLRIGVQAPRSDGAALLALQSLIRRGLVSPVVDGPTTHTSFHYLTGEGHAAAAWLIKHGR